MSQRLRTNARSEREIDVRRDRQRAQPRMTRNQGEYMISEYPPNAEKSGDWRTWWVFGCGRNENGTPYCPDGHRYYIERQDRGAHRRSKILGRRKQRRRLNRLTSEDE